MLSIQTDFVFVLLLSSDANRGIIFYALCRLTNSKDGELFLTKNDDVK